MLAMHKRTKVSKRIASQVPDRTGDIIEKWADIEGRSVSNLISYLVQKAIDQSIRDGTIPRGVIEEH
jgi:hypothetical protein